jgi:ABC-2 type transport system permease protein
VFPLVVIEGYGYAMTAFPEFPFMETVPETMGRINGAIYAAAFLAAILGLFQVISALQADERLQLCGYSRAELFATRLAAVVGASLLVAAVSLSVLAWRVEVGAPFSAFLALAAAALIYGLIGMLVGAVLPRALEGSLVLVFLIDADDFLSSGMIDIDSALLELFPLSHPHALFREAVLDGTTATGEALSTGAYLLVLLAVVAVVYVRLTDGGELRG